MKLSFALAIIAVVTPTLASTAKLFCANDNGAVNKCKTATNAPDWLKDVDKCQAYVNDSGFNQTLRNCFNATLSATNVVCADIIPGGKCHGSQGYCDRLESVCGFGGTNRFATKDACKTAVDGGNGVLKTCVDTHLQFAVDDTSVTLKNTSAHCMHASMANLCTLSDTPRTFGLAIKRADTNVNFPTADQIRAALATQLAWAIAAADLGTGALAAGEKYLDPAGFAYKDNSTDGNVTSILPIAVKPTTSFEQYFNLAKLAALTELTVAGTTYKVSAFRQCATVESSGNVCGGFQCGCPASFADTTGCVKQNTVVQGLDRKKCISDKINRGLFLQSFWNSLKKQDDICQQITSVNDQCTENYLISTLYEDKKCSFGANTSYSSAAAFRTDLDKVGRTVKKCLMAALINNTLPNGVPTPNATKCMDAAGKGNCDTTTSFTFSATCGGAACTQAQINDKIKAILAGSNQLSSNFDVNDFGGTNVVTADGNNWKITVRGPIPPGTNLQTAFAASLPSDLTVTGFTQAPTPGTNPPVKGSVALASTISAMLFAVLVAVLML